MQDKMSTAKGRLGLFAGFWLALASKLGWRAVPAEQCGGVAATDARNVYYCLEQLNTRPLGEVVYIALHEIGHNMLCHLTRATHHPTWDKGMMNTAMDIVLNELLDKIAAETPALGMITPADATRGAAFGGGFEGMTWEAAYRKLLKDGKQGACGHQFDLHMAPKGDDGKPMTPSEADALGKEWAVSVQAAAIMAKQIGKLPGFLEGFIGELIKPKIDWRSQLQNCVTRIARDESSYRRFNRRHMSRGSYLPGMYSERIGRVAYGMDTSGSIGSDEFKAGMGAMTDILEEMKPEAIVHLQCDTQLHDVIELKLDDLPLPLLKVCGRGGTDMNPAFEWACQNEHDLDAFILQTDGYVPPLHQMNIPNIPVIIIVTTNATLPEGWDFPNVVRVEL